MVAKPKLVAVVLVVGVAVWLVGAQFVSQPAGPAQLSVVQPAVGLAGTSVVNIDSTSVPGADPYGYILLGPDPLVLYEVPADRWLLLTDVEFSTDSPSPELVQVVGQQVTVKRNATFNYQVSSIYGLLSHAYHSSVGIGFAPGSAVALRPGPGGSYYANFTLTGYLTRP